MPPPDHGPSTGAWYWELEADLAPGDEELWGLFCFESGATGAEVVAESGDEMTIRHFFAAPPIPGWDAGGAGAAVPRRVLAALEDGFARRFPQAAPPLRLRLARRPVEQWETAWREHFRPLPIGERLLITPPWETGIPAAADPGPEDAGSRLRVVIDPGMGFGTGWHPSTHLGLEMLEAYFQGRGLPAPPAPPAMLDVGTGSGILAIAGGLFGASPIAAVDIDRNALPEVRRNFALSGLPAPALLALGGPDCLRGPFGLVVANIIPPVLSALRGHLVGLTAAGGCLIVSGILSTERQGLLEDYLGGHAGGGLRVVHEATREGWWACCFRRE